LVTRNPTAQNARFVIAKARNQHFDGFK